jgi:hypothetical protein
MTHHRRSQVQRCLATGIAVAALAAPAAQAAPSLEPGSKDTSQSSTAEVRGVEPEPVAADSPPVTTTIDEGFDWGSAAIGAGGAGALIALAALGGFAPRVSTRHPRRRP